MNDYKCDIILLSYESPDLLKRCVQSVLECTRVRSKLIIVDNASLDPEVVRYLKDVHGNETVEVEKLMSEENAGFAGGINKGLQLSLSPFVCILNNDCVVTDGWLEEMIQVSESREDIGLVNPQSNTFGSRPRKDQTIEDHAEDVRKKRGQFTEIGHAIGFACLIKREVIEKIGYLDEAYEGVCYEDTDYSVRAYRAGYTPVVAEGAYVYHTEQASRKNLPGKERIYEKNRKIFEKRWGRLLRVLYVDDASGQKEDPLDVYNNLKFLARERAFIDFWTSAPELKDIKIDRHADINIRFFSKKPGCIQILFKALTKKKKYDAIVLKNKQIGGIFRILKNIHKAKLFSADSNSITSEDNKKFSLDKSSDLAEYIRKGER